jgi:hypothetical protein
MSRLKTKDDVFEIQGACLLDMYINIVKANTLWVYGQYIWEGEASFPSPL